MTSKTATTVHRSREEVQRLWSGDLRPELADGENAEVTFKDAPGGRGTEIHVELAKRGFGGSALARAKDELRRFKQQVETGEIARADAPEGVGVR